MISYDTRRGWLPGLGCVVPDAADTLALAEAELKAGTAAYPSDQPVRLAPTGQKGEGYAISKDERGYVITGGDTGILYGAYAFLRRAALGERLTSDWSEPAFRLRMLNHWDNMSDGIERGYAGKSLFFKDGHFNYDPARLREYARLLASIGINTISVNNVNVLPPADGLITALLPRLAELAGLFRPFGIRLLVAVDYALPVTCGLETADPLDARVQAWWRETTARVYERIPDLRGYLVKADSEFRPGPNMYGRNHAQGARLLSDALAPFGGELVWRCFVYNCRQDWRDYKTDRPKASYDNYAGLDEQFDPNTLLQIKYGPFDFQVREATSPLFYAMPHTAKAMELQLTQEYTGHQIDLYYMAPQWREIMSSVAGYPIDSLCAVANVGLDDCWTGHDLAQANLFAYGELGWQGKIDPESTARQWARLTFGNDPQVISRITDMLLRSRAVYEKYTAPLGLCWMVVPHEHYGPSPEGYEYTAWGTYLRADRDGVGVDRSSRGTGYTQQYPPEMAARYDDPASCPQELLLFFHHLPYDYRLPCGKTLIQFIYDAHFEGAAEAEALAESWRSLKGRIPADVFERVSHRFEKQIANAREWRDVVNTYFHRYSGIPDDQGRKIY